MICVTWVLLDGSRLENESEPLEGQSTRSCRRATSSTRPTPSSSASRLDGSTEGESIEDCISQHRKELPVNRQDNEESIRRLAFSVFCLTKHLGKEVEVAYPFLFEASQFVCLLTLSPEVTLLGYQVQVCVLSRQWIPPSQIYVDQEMKFPGGSVTMITNIDFLPFRSTPSPLLLL